MTATAETHKHLDAALNGIELVLLLGGPRGSGKTTHAARLVEGSARSSFLEGYRGSLSRATSKSLARGRFPPGGLVVEFATNRLDDPAGADAVRAYIRALQDRARVVGAHTIEVSSSELFRRYLKRMRGLEFLHLGKLKSLAHYAFARRTDSGLTSWKAILAELGIENRPMQGAGNAAEPDLAPPLACGADTAAVLREAGLGEEQIAGVMPRAKGS